MNIYPEYKVTNIHWVGTIPKHWQVKKIKYSTYVKGRVGWHGLTSNDFTEEGPFLVTGTDFMKGRVNWQTCYHISEENYNRDPYIKLRENDLLITKDGTIGKVAIVKNLKEKATLNSGIFVTRPLANSYLTSFLYWVLNSPVFDRFIDYNKIGSTIQHLYQDTFEEFSFPVPSEEEQKIIATYLDRKTIQIDSLIVKKQRLIELLKEERATIINHAVTKGIDPNVKMKDSGIEWLGEIPEHWEVKKLKYIIEKIGSGVTPKGGASVYQQKGIPLLRSQNVHFDGLRLDDVAFISEEIHNEMIGSRVLAGDVLLNITGASIGRCCVVPADIKEANVNQHVCILRSAKTIDSYFLCNYLTSEKGQIQIFSSEKGISREGLNYEQIKSFIVPIPPKTEQHEIINYIANENKILEKTISKILHEIDLLQEYRTALISEVITGKIDIRNEVVA